MGYNGFDAEKSAQKASLCVTVFVVKCDAMSCNTCHGTLHLPFTAVEKYARSEHFYFAVNKFDVKKAGVRCNRTRCKRDPVH